MDCAHTSTLPLLSRERLSEHRQRRCHTTDTYLSQAVTLFDISARWRRQLADLGWVRLSKLGPA